MTQRLRGHDCPQHGRRRRGLIAATLAAALTIAASGDAVAVTSAEGTSPDDAASSGGIARVGMFAEAGTFDPPQATQAATLSANVHIFEGILDVDNATREIRPGLSDFPEEIDDTTYRITVREGATFHNGDPVTADDVVYSIDRTLNRNDELQGASSFFGRFLVYIESATAVDERTVEIKLAFPVEALNDGLAIVKVVPMAHVEEVGVEEFNNNPVGSGPYQFVEFTSLDRVVLEAFDGYNGAYPPVFDGIEFLIQPDAGARIAAFRAGETIAVADIPDRDIQAVEGEESLEVASEPSFLMHFLMFNLENEKFADPRVRQALHFAIDRDTITEVAYGGNATPSSAYLPENHPDYSEADAQYPYDPDRARELLAEAGFEDGLNFDLNVWTDNTWAADAANIIEQNWADVGVTVNKTTGGEDLYGTVTDGTYEAQLAIADQSIFGYDADVLLSWHLSDFWADTFTFWTGPERERSDELFDEGLRAFGDERLAAYAEIQNIAAEELSIYPLHHRNTVTGWNSDVFATFTPTQAAIIDLREAELN